MRPARLRSLLRVALAGPALLLLPPSALPLSRPAGPEPPPVRAATGSVRTAFARDQCTWWAYGRRPDIIDSTVAGQPRLLDWDAYRWAVNAERGGYVVSDRPRPGAIAVWPRNAAGAGPVGHVAYVERVEPDGSFVVSEINWTHPHGYDRRIVRRSRDLRFVLGHR